MTVEASAASSAVVAPATALMTRSSQRSDIQGLRAVAVLLVVAFHLWPEQVTGGYVGVDVFFVISGFLISSRLISEAETTGTVALGDFWARRIRRLLPAAFVVLAACLVATSLIVPRSLVMQTLKEIAASVVYVLNWLLGADSVDYSAAANVPTLVQHFWTLSVEEQFYVVWPVLLVASLWVAYRGMRIAHTPGKARGIAAFVLTTTVVASLAYSVQDTYSNGASAYFSTASRLWEFAIGGLLVLATRPRRQDSRLANFDRPLVRASLGWIGLGLIMYSAFAFGSETPFPGWLASLPVVGGALVIVASNTSERLGVGPLLSLRPARWIGDLSYSIYLWHWPLIIAFPYAVGHAPGPVRAAAILAATLALAAATKYGVEDPLRFRTRLLETTRRAFVFMVVGCAVLLGAVAVDLAVLSNQESATQAALDDALESGKCVGAAALDPSQSCPDPFAITPTVDTAHAALDAAWNFGPTVAACPERPGHIATCQYASGSEAKDALSVALVGDSHAEHLLPALYVGGEAAGWRTEFVIGSGCPGVFLSPDGGLPTAYEGQEDDPVFGECHTWSTKVMDDLVERKDIDVVIFSFHRVYKLEPAELVHQFDRVRDSGKVVLLARDLPGIEPDVAAPACIDASGGQYDPCAWVPTSDAQAPLNEAWRLGEGRFGYVDLWDSFCDAERCHAVIGGLVAYFDDKHVTTTYSETLAPYFLTEIKEAMASPKVLG